MAIMTLMGLYNYDDSIFDNMVLPEDVDQQTMIEKIIFDCAELEILYPDPDFMKFAIGSWSASQIVSWDRFYQAMIAEYDPIENYNRHEEETVTDEAKHTGTDTRQYSSESEIVSQEDAEGLTETVNSITAFDSNALADHDKQDHNSSVITDTTTNGNQTATDTNTKNLKDDNTRERLSHIHGNIGVTTSQQMLEQEILIVPKLNIYDIISAEFRKRFCLLVY